MKFVLLFLSFFTLSCQSMQRIELKINDATLIADVARTKAQREQGLMGIRDLPPNYGMLFVFETEQNASFWMKKTYIPLSIAFITRDGIIREIRSLTPHSLESVISRWSVSYALEVEKGLFEKLGIKMGDKVHFPKGFY